MSLIDAIRYRLRVLLHPRAHDAELAEEVDFHVDLETMQREHLAQGALSRQAAHEAARRRFGNATYYQEESRREAGLAFFDVLAQDVRFALRSFRRTPTFTAVVVATLAIGIGANTAIFSAVDALLLRPLPFSEPDRLVSLSITAPAIGRAMAREDVPWSYPKLAILRDAQTGFDDLTFWFTSQFTLRVDNEAVREWGDFVDSHYLPTLRVTPVLGRNFLPDEDRPGMPRTILISDALWKRVFNADPEVLGNLISVDGVPFTVIGVLPERFHGLTSNTQFWIPLAAGPLTWPKYFADPRNHTLFAIARLAPGMSVERAGAMMQRVGALVDAAYPEPGPVGFHFGATARALDATRADSASRRTLFMLLGAVALVLLIACANVANLFLVRATGRRREIAVRLAIGAGRWRLVRQLLVESVLLSLLGGVASLGVALAGVRTLSMLPLGSILRLQSSAGLGTSGISSVRLDGTAFLFTAALAVATGIVFGLVPALQATRPALTESLKDDGSPRGGREEGPVRALKGRNLLAIVEITLAVVLLSGSGLLLRSLQQVLGVRPGFDAEHVLTARVNRAPNWSFDSIATFYDVAVNRLASIPGVTAAAIADCPPFGGGCRGARLTLLDRPRGPSELDPVVGVHWITPDWLSVVRVPLLSGRPLTSADTKQSPKVVLVSQLAARALWPGENPLGKAVAFASQSDTAYVVGVVGDVRYDAMEAPPRPDIYVSYYQLPISDRMTLMLRTQGDPRALADATRKALREVAPGFPIYDFATLSARIGYVTAYARFCALFLSLFAAIALALAMMGTYGVISFSVSQRTREMGIRLALGATGRHVIRLVVRQGLILAMVGATMGIGAALATSRVLESLLYGVQPTDPATLIGIVTILLSAVVVASWIPARRAASVPAVEALRGG
jgi:predicted permease